MTRIDDAPSHARRIDTANSPSKSEYHFINKKEATENRLWQMATLIQELTYMEMIGISESMALSIKETDPTDCSNALLAFAAAELKR